jgi:proline iminopeptidase
MFNHGCCRLLACLAAWLAGAGAMAADMPKLLPTLPNYDIPFHGKGSFAPTPDGRLYFEAEGSGPPLVLLAGGPGSAHNGFHPWFGQLADRFTVYYVDNIGRGRSDRLPAEQSHRYTVERDAGDVEALRRYLKVDKIAVLGQSAGGQVALEYALAYPDHVSKLILSNPLYNPAHWRLNIEIAKHVTRDYFPEIWEQELAARAKGMQTGDANYPQISSGPRMEYFLHQVQRGNCATVPAWPLKLPIPMFMRRC